MPEKKISSKEIHFGQAVGMSVKRYRAKNYAFIEVTYQDTKIRFAEKGSYVEDARQFAELILAACDHPCLLE